MLLLRPSIAFSCLPESIQSREPGIKGRITLTSSLQLASPGTGGLFQLDGDKKRRQRSRVCLQHPGEQPGTLCRVLTSFSTSTFLLQFSDRHTHRLQGINPLSFHVNFFWQKTSKQKSTFLQKNKALLDNLDKIRALDRTLDCFLPVNIP